MWRERLFRSSQATIMSGFLLCAGSVQAQMLYNITDLSSRDSLVISVERINDAGEYIGNIARTVPVYSIQGYFRGADSLAEMPTFGGPHSGAAALNDSGQVTGFAYHSDSEWTAYRWHRGQMTKLGILAGYDRSAGYGINNIGVVVGEVKNNTDFKAFRWENNVMQPLPALDEPGSSRAFAINDAGVIIGDSHTDVRRPVKWVNGSVSTLDGLQEGFEYSAIDINVGGTIMGTSTTPDGYNRAIIWKNGQIQELGDLGNINSSASAINDSGEVVGVSNRLGFLWKDGTIYDLNTLIDPNSGWSVFNCRDINNRGEIVALARKGTKTSYVLLTPAPFILKTPAAANVLVGGEKDTIRWLAAPGIQNVRLRFSPDSGATFHNIIDVPILANTGEYVWTVPDTVLSRECIVQIFNADPNFQDQVVNSKTFAVKGYQLTRLDADSEYEPFEPAKHGWRFSNTRSNMYPKAWYQQFDYASGEDPFTDGDYPDWFTEPSVNAKAAYFPDWPSFVRSFGTDAAYHFLIDDFYGIYRTAAAEKWAGLRSGAKWRGSCSGLVITSLMAFGHRADFNTSYPDIMPTDSLYSLTGATLGLDSDEHNRMRELINQLYVHWWGKAAKAHRQVVRTNNPRETLAELKTMFLDTTRDYRGYLYISNVDGAGAHAVAPYRMERDPVTPANDWQVFVYDPNAPGDATRFVLVDSTANTWNYVHPSDSSWGGGVGMYLMNGVRSHLAIAQLPEGSATMLKAAVPAEAYHQADHQELEVYVTAGATTNIISSAGTIGYAAGAIYNTLEGAYANNPPTGFETPPVGYFLPDGPYRIELTGTPEQSARVAIFGDSLVYSYFRTTEHAEDVDLLEYSSDGITVGNPGARMRPVRLKGIALTESSERVVEVVDASLPPGGQLKFGVVNGKSARLENGSGASTYTLRLRRSDRDSSVSFYHPGIQLPADARHEIRPDWLAPTIDTVQVLIDTDSDGTFDDSLLVANQPDIGTSAEGRSANALPGNFALHQNYPNPFNPSTTIRYDLPEPSHVRIAIYDLAGRLADELDVGARTAGVHNQLWQPAGLPSGIYLYELDARGASGREFRQVRKMVLVR